MSGHLPSHLSTARGNGTFLLLALAAEEMEGRASEITRAGRRALAFRDPAVVETGRTEGKKAFWSLRREESSQP